MKTYLLWFIALFTIVSYSQGKYITISEKNSDRIETIDENIRIKVKTVDGKKYWGRFTVVDSVSLMIEGNIVPLNSITMIKRKTIAASIVRPVAVTVGGVLVVVGITGAAVVTGYGVLITVLYVPPGIPMVLVPISNNHPTKEWVYSIKNKNESSTYSDGVGLGESPTEP